MALIGCGRWGVNHARTAATSGSVHFVGVVDPDQPQRFDAMARYGVRGWPTLSDALRDERVEAVVIASPAGTHVSLALEAMRAGRHVLVEKPAALSALDASAMSFEARRRGVQLSAGHTFLYSQPVRNIAAWLREAAPSRPWLIRSERLGGRRREDCDVLWNLAPHDVSILLHLVDEPVVHVAARGHIFPGGRHWDLAAVDLTFASGIRGEVYVGWRHAGAKRALRLLGEQWALRYRHGRADGDAVQLTGEAATAGAEQILHRGCGRSPSGALRQYAEPLRVQLEEFVSACRTGQPTLTGPSHLTAVTRVLHAAHRSASTGGASVRLDARRADEQDNDSTTANVGA
ncbi:Gfo/Idh/MocA family protein [Peterkaempfera bronchialis]|nr:Gfo/Idh/MocA family oxidoreductase [Peterkaempfera bronchialis]